jgi:hydrogenase small subunit
MQKKSTYFHEMLAHKGVSRRDFLKFCSLMAGVLAIPKSFDLQIAEALETKKRTPVIWLEMQDCAGCSESFLRASRPSAADIVLETLSVDYHETIMAASGHLAEEAKAKTIEAGGYLLVVEGSIPKNEDGIYCCIGGRSAVDLLQEAAKNALAIVAVGSCASFGGVASANPNPTGAVGVMDLVKDKPIINLPGCPVNVVNLTATVVHFLTFGELPAVDDKLRPLFAYGALIHNNCERRGHFDAGEFVRAWGDEGHRNGWCLFQMGCKGPMTYHNCPSVRWNEGTSWPVHAGHGCIGCSEPGFWDIPMYSTLEMSSFLPPSTFPSVGEDERPVPAGNIAATAATLGVIAGAAATVGLRHLSKKPLIDVPEAASDADPGTPSRGGKEG